MIMDCFALAFEQTWQIMLRAGRQNVITKAAICIDLGTEVMFLMI